MPCFFKNKNLLNEQNRIEISYKIDPIKGKAIYEKALDEVGLTLNANALPTDKGGAFRPSGVRLGTPAITTRGLGIKEMKKLAGWMKQVADICVKAGQDNNLKNYSKELNKIILPPCV